VSGTQIPSGSVESTALTAAIRAVTKRLSTISLAAIVVSCSSTAIACSVPSTTPKMPCRTSLLRAWRYRESLIEGAPLRPWLYRVATNVCLDAMARDERSAGLAGRL